MFWEDAGMGPAICLGKINQSMISPCQQRLEFPTPPQYFVLKNAVTCYTWKKLVQYGKLA